MSKTPKKSGESGSLRIGTLEVPALRLSKDAFERMGAGWSSPLLLPLSVDGEGAGG